MGGGHKGQKKRQRGGASKAVDGWAMGFERWMAIFSFFPPTRSLLLFLTLSTGSSLQQNGVVAGKAARSTKVGLSSKDAVLQISHSSPHTIPPPTPRHAGMQSEQSPRGDR